MSVALALMAIGGLVGAAGGANGAQARANAARRNFGLAEDYLESVRKRNAQQRNILVGNLSMTALSTNAQNRNTAMEVEAANDAQRNAIGSSGLSGGTPFYKLDQDIRDRQMAVVEQNMANRLKMGSAYDEAVAGMAGMDFEETKARYQLMDAGKESEYTNSFMGTVMPMVSGAMQGASTASSLMSMGVQSSLLTEDFLASGFGDLFKSKAADTTSDLYDPGNYGGSTQIPVMGDLYSGLGSPSFTGLVDIMGSGTPPYQPIMQTPFSGVYKGVWAHRPQAGRPTYSSQERGPWRDELNIGF